MLYYGKKIHVYNNVPDNYVSAMLAFLHPLKLQFCKKLYIKYKIIAERVYIHFCSSVSQLTGEILNNLQKFISNWKRKTSIGETIFLREILKIL